MQHRLALKGPPGAARLRGAPGPNPTPAASRRDSGDPPLSSPHVGFACNWDPDPSTTWSGTPWALRQALAQKTLTSDVGVQFGRAARLTLKALHARRAPSGPVSVWQHSSLTDGLITHRLRHGIATSMPEVVLEIQDLGIVDRPYATYQDLTYDVLLGLLDSGHQLTHFPGFSRRRLEARAERQRRIHHQASAILVMSRWLADELAATGLPRRRIHVVHPGINTALPVIDESLAPNKGPFRPDTAPRLLFVGRDFFSKGGDLVVRAHELLRREHDPETTLVVAGPAAWPLRRPPGPGVRFVGHISRQQVAEELRHADLLLMPSRFEGFGIAIAEALVSGTPVIARRAFAMPEIIRPGHDGELITDDDHVTLAATVLRCFQDEELYRRVWTGRQVAAERWSWSRAAGEIVDILSDLHP